jgi:hypothetical protein
MKDSPKGILRRVFGAKVRHRSSRPFQLPIHRACEWVVWDAIEQQVWVPIEAVGVDVFRVGMDVTRKMNR